MYYLSLKRTSNSRYYLYVKLKHKVVDVLASLDYDSSTKNIVAKYYFYKIRYWINKLKLDDKAVEMFETIYEQKLKVEPIGRGRLVGIVPTIANKFSCVDPNSSKSS